MPGENNHGKKTCVRPVRQNFPLKGGLGVFVLKGFWNFTKMGYGRVVEMSGEGTGILFSVWEMGDRV